VIDFYATREEARATLKQVLEDEPGRADVLEVVEVELGSASENCASIFAQRRRLGLRCEFHAVVAVHRLASPLSERRTPDLSAS
jgi:hypothetical protein